MSKIFRLYKEGYSTYQDWNHSPVFPYNSAARDTIEDPDGASARNEITSIPSPFARIDLVKRAFKEVCIPDSNGRVNLDGNTIYHKMVSDTLDVAEIFFNIDKYKGKIEVIKWDSQLMLAQLENSSSIGHRYLADALRKFMMSDASTYNFNAVRNLYLLNYTEGPDEINIIGSTSPATLFFSNANDLSYVKDIFFGEDLPFDSVYQPLYKRDFEFVKYLFTLRKSIPNFASLFPELDLYLTTTFRAISDQDKKQELNSVTSTLLDDLAVIEVADINQNDIVEVLGHTLYQKKVQDIGHIESDFTIKTKKELDIFPLVLPIEAGNRYSELQYTTGKWGKTNHAPFKDKETDLERRSLPFDGGQRPYLTISDFLEDTIISVPHTLNSTNYFDGRIKIDKPCLSFLLPITPLFFRYFSVEELRGEMWDGKPMFEMRLLAGDSVSVTLRIPIKGSGNVRYVEYNRVYYKNNTADLVRNSGGMSEFRFTGFVMPLVKFNNTEAALYNVSCLQPSSGKIAFNFYKGENKLLPVSVSTRDLEEIEFVRPDNYLIKGRFFDYIQVTSPQGIKGVVIPLFRKQRNIETFEFTVDLGTSNTHIEYRMGEESPRVFDMTQEERHLCEIFVPFKNELGVFIDLGTETLAIERDFVPETIGLGAYYFPTRTVLSCAKTIDWDQIQNPFTMINIPFTYDKRRGLEYNSYRTNIKWGTGKDMRLMESYVRCLMVIMRNKVLMNNGDLKRTKIKWFYPISMPPKRLSRLKEIWDSAFQEYFGEGLTVSMTESAAPMQYYFRRYSTATNLVNVDIGGGTTDISFGKDRKILNITSFRFAANALFENSYSQLDNTNGIVDTYKEKLIKLLKEKCVDELVNVGQSAYNNNPANAASFLFGLKDSELDNLRGIDNNAKDFNKILREDEDFKIVFLIFYTSIIYHIAQITKALGIEPPRHISFSGNGSRVIRVITSDTKVLERYTKIIFEKILGKPFTKPLELLGLEKDSNPKEATCKGGLLGEEEDDNGEKIVILKSDGSGFEEACDTYAGIGQSYKDRTVTAVGKFFRFVFDEMNEAFDFDRNFGVNPKSISIAREAAARDLETFLDKGLSERMEESDGDKRIEETLFFYPIKGVLQTMSADIYEMLKNKNE